MQIHKIVRKLQYFEVGVYKIPEIVKQFVIGNEFGSGLKPNSHSDAVMVLKKRIVVQVQNWRAKTGTRTETESRNERERRTENRNKLLHSLIISCRHVIIFNLFMKFLRQHKHMQFKIFTVRKRKNIANGRNLWGAII